MQIPTKVKYAIEKLEAAGYEAYIVGGCVRDLLLGKKPKDWDITTNAKPEEIQRVFPDSFYENQFGTVGVKTESEDQSLKVIEITTYRIESAYSDKRHPDEVKFTSSIEEDLRRRDFTINTLAMDKNGELKDLFGGQDDIKNKKIRAVGEPNERFNEDALRLMRAVRLASELNFEIEEKTLESIQKNAGALQMIAKERIRDELEKLINSDQPAKGLKIMRETGLLKFVMPELLEGYGVGQNKHHIYNVWEHNLNALKYAADKKYSFVVRMASLLHDVGKPRSKRGEGPDSTFYGHEVIGARMAAEILSRLRFSKDISEKIVKLVRYHLFYYNVGEVTESSVRRLLAKVGPENIEDLIKVREADRIGSGVPKAVPYKLRHLKFIIEKVSKDPISVKMLVINGNDVMEILGISPGPKVGLLLNSLLAQVLEDPSLNTREKLLERARELDKKTADELRENLVKIEKAQEHEEKEMMKKYGV